MIWNTKDRIHEFTLKNESPGSLYFYSIYILAKAGHSSYINEHALNEN